VSEAAEERRTDAIDRVGNGRPQHRRPRLSRGDDLRSEEEEHCRNGERDRDALRVAAAGPHHAAFRIVSGLSGRQSWQVSEPSRASTGGSSEPQFKHVNWASSAFGV
jgi:hypothetical protein